MIVMVGIYANVCSVQRLPGGAQKVRMGDQLLRQTLAANMLIQADDLIAGRHDQMKVMRDHGDGALALLLVFAN